MKKTNTPSNYLLIGLTVLAVIIFALVENSRSQIKRNYYRSKVEASELSQLAQKVIRDYAREKGFPFDLENDPGESGLVGQQFTLITTDTGKLSSKLASTNPDYAAAFIEMFNDADLKSGDVVAVATTGSFPALNVSLFAALKVMELKPIIITSIGSSSWGANNPDFTWLDMEAVLYQKKIFNFRSVAASMGGGGDRGRGLSPKGRQLLKDAIHRNKNIANSEIELDFLYPKNHRESIDNRLDCYARWEKKFNKQIKMYINIGGGISSLGSNQNRYLIPGGLSKKLYNVQFPVEGVITHMIERGLPIIHMLKIERIGLNFGISPVPYANPETIRQGKLYYREIYNVWFTVLLTIILLFVLVTMLRLDVKHYIFRIQKNIKK